jgi:hypothetical protein
MADPNTTGDDDPRQDTYDPSELEATRMRDQGLGVGQRDMDRQRDPTREVEDRSFQPMVDAGDPDEPASGGMQQGANHTRWETKDETWGQGPKTLAKQREQQKRST